MPNATPFKDEGKRVAKAENYFIGASHMERLSKWQLVTPAVLGPEHRLMFSTETQQQMTY